MRAIGKAFSLGKKLKTEKVEVLNKYIMLTDVMSGCFILNAKYRYGEPYMLSLIHISTRRRDGVSEM